MATLAPNPPPVKKGGFRRLDPPTFTDEPTRKQYQKGSVALAARIMDMQGWGVGYSFAISGRDALDPSLVWLIPRTKPLRTVGSKDLIGVDFKGNVVQPGADGQTKFDDAVYVHLAIYAARADVNGIVSGNTPNGRVFSARAEPPKILWQDSCTFYKQVGVLPFAASLGAREDPAAVAAAIEDKKGLILENRGLLTCIGTIEGAVALYLRLEGLTGGQMLAEAAAKGRGVELTEVGEEEALFTQGNLSSQHHAWMMGTPNYKKVSGRIGLDQATI